MIINADDFGLNKEINAAIAECFTRGFCSSATIMANMAGFKDACNVVKTLKLHHHVGMHLVLTEGKALSESIKQCKRFCDENGDFIVNRKKRIVYLNRLESEAVLSEFKLQIDRCRDHGIMLTHADSHNHIHEEWGIGLIVMEVCRQKGIRYIRLARNMVEKSIRLKQTYRYFFNLKLKMAGFSHIRLFGSLEDYNKLKKAAYSKILNDSIEIMVHPSYNQSGVLVDTPTGRSVTECMRILDPNVPIVSYSGRSYKM